MEFDDLEAHGRKDGGGGCSQIHSPYREKEVHYLYLGLVHFTKPGNNESCVNSNCPLWQRSPKHLAEFVYEMPMSKGKVESVQLLEDMGIPKARLAWFFTRRSFKLSQEAKSSQRGETIGPRTAGVYGKGAKEQESLTESGNLE